MSSRSSLAPLPAPGAVRANLASLTALLGLAALAWWATAERMAGMNGGPGTPLGTLGWFSGAWTLMMAAMMLPSLARTIAREDHQATRGAPFALLAGYLLVWSATGPIAYALFALGQEIAGHTLAWASSGRWLAAGALVLAALYQFSPLKRRCLARCRSIARDTPSAARGAGAFERGLRAGGWCIGCSWALMLALFALGVMSITAMAAIALLVALEKLARSERAPRLATAAVLVLLAAMILVQPHDIPGFVVPSGPAPMHAMAMSG